MERETELKVQIRCPEKKERPLLTAENDILRSAAGVLFNSMNKYKCNLNPQKLQEPPKLYSMSVFIKATVNNFIHFISFQPGFSLAPELVLGNEPETTAVYPTDNMK